jgi:organic hydroperoxide reductase OsmC/OhrA
MTNDTARPPLKPKKYTYSTGLEWRGGRGGELRSEGKSAFRVVSPPEFKGEAGFWTPEDLFVSAVETCTMMTFLAFAERDGLPLVSYESVATGTLELVDGGFQFTHVVVRPRVRVRVEADVVRALELFGKSHRACLVTRSVQSKIDLEPEVAVANMETSELAMGRRP